MKMNSSFLPIILLSLFLFLSFPSFSLSVRCNPKDKQVLLQIKKDLGNPYHLASWDPNTDCCYWYVVKCDRKTNRINALTVFQANISGQIPAAVGDLPYLEILQFHHITNLTGTIQPTIAKLTNLKQLRLSFTNLTGQIPEFLSQLRNLTLLELNYNQFTGTIPSSFSQLPNLLAIHLDRNKLTGQIPESFGKFKGGQIPELYLSHNSLTGPVPRSLGDLNFTRLDFSRNKLEGDVSFLFGKNKTIQDIDLSRNTLEFDISKLEFPESLTSLDLNHNKIYGRLPEGLKDLELQYLNVSYNRLCGEIPQGGKLQSFDVYSYLHNKCLCGSPLPDCK
ncbi:polygalacturonase inhibitor-like [Lycium barbarum]|uniref:polygalacturonase inhibitor-like n=1 Tax=Lycium barbarum TaxID=112863 RepID=UPI00293F43DF|nr:polygalacturonase inhibitor-like [Lycium barbarum]